jgi:hypothetical protein
MTNVHLYEAALREYQLDYYLVGGRAFFAQQEIYDLLNVLRALENPQDAVSLAGTLRSPFCSVSDEALFLLNRHPDGLWAGLHNEGLRERLPEDQCETADRARRHLDRWRSLKDRLPIVRLLGEVFADSGYDAAMQFETLGDRKLANLWKLMDLARTFDRSGRFGLAEFIQGLGDLVRTQPREEQAATQPENADVIRLMTIHQAKGLEFPVVIVPDVATVGGGPHYPVVTWDARLGTVVRPPADEESPPFADFAWEVWKAVESIEEWQEDLRTLYVACTRAQDYLVLSAALAENVRPANAWMTTLTERFDLRSGTCRASGIPAANMPRVRVADSGTPPPEPEPRRFAQGSTAGEEVEASPLATMPIAIRLTGREILTVGQLEQCLRRGGDGLGPADVGLQFDAEDGSDRTAWVAPRQALDGGQAADMAERDRLLRWVLERWDFQDADGWKELLRQAPGRDTPKTVEMEPLFASFAVSPVFRQLAGAAVCYRNVEFLTALEAGGATIRGVMDFLWQDERGDWHVLTVTAERVAAAERGRDWECRVPGLALAAQAVHQNHGAWPKSVTLFYLMEGVAVTRAGSRLGRSKSVTRLAKMLR